MLIAEMLIAGDEALSRKRDKKLKKELKRQKKLQKLAMAGLKPGEEESLKDHEKQNSDSNEEECDRPIDLSQANERSKSAVAPTIENSDDLKPNDSTPASKPHLSLKISKGNLVKPVCIVFLVHFQG